jgi:hypothetical protein
VFDAIVRNLGRLFGTRLAMVQVLKDGMIHLAAAADELEFDRLNQQFPRPLDETSGGGRAMLSKQVLQFAPVLGNPAAPLVAQGLTDLPLCITPCEPEPNASRRCIDMTHLVRCSHGSEK